MLERTTLRQERWQKLKGAGPRRYWFKCRFCAKNVDINPPCCAEYTGPKSDPQQAQRLTVK